jgi:hypothetical protein
MKTDPDKAMGQELLKINGRSVIVVVLTIKIVDSKNSKIINFRSFAQSTTIAVTALLIQFNMT